MNEARRVLPGLGYALIHLLLAMVLVYAPIEQPTSLVTGTQLVAHGFGDYVLQSHWMAVNKSRHWWIALLHAASYTVPFLLLTHSPAAILTIWLTHAVIDHLRLARLVVWARNVLGGEPMGWDECRATGMPPESPAYLATWLLIIADNCMHVVINAAAIRWL
jgi:hypothetical protein